MVREELTEAYLDKFPTILKNILMSNESYQEEFIDSVKTEYVPRLVYRALHRENEIKYDDFVCNVTEAELYERPLRRKLQLNWYSVSVNEDIQELIKSTRFPNVKRPLVGIAQGIMCPEYGPADNMELNAHHNWYIFEDVIPKVIEEFEVIDLSKISYLFKKGDEKSGETVSLG